MYVTEMKIISACVPWCYEFHNNGNEIEVSKHHPRSFTSCITVQSERWSVKFLPLMARRSTKIFYAGSGGSGKPNLISSGGQRDPKGVERKSEVWES